MQMRTDPDRGTTRLGHPAIELALESLPFVSRACVARADARETVVLVSVDPGRFDDLESGSPVKEEARRVLTRHGIDPTGIRVVATTGWLPGREAFPARIRRRCARARYAPLLATIVTPVLTPLASPLVGA